MNERRKKLRNRIITEYLLRWKGYDHLHDTWEEERNMNCPELLAEWRRTHPQSNAEVARSPTSDATRHRNRSRHHNSGDRAPVPAPPPSDPRTAIRHILPTSALRGRTRAETERLQRLKASALQVPPISIEEVKALAPRLRPLAAVHPTLAALVYLQEYKYPSNV